MHLWRGAEGGRVGVFRGHRGKKRMVAFFSRCGEKTGKFKNGLGGWRKGERFTKKCNHFTRTNREPTLGRQNKKTVQTDQRIESVVNKTEVPRKGNSLQGPIKHFSPEPGEGGVDYKYRINCFCVGPGREEAVRATGVKGGEC